MGRVSNLSSHELQLTIAPFLDADRCGKARSIAFTGDITTRWGSHEPLPRRTQVEEEKKEATAGAAATKGGGGGDSSDNVEIGIAGATSLGKYTVESGEVGYSSSGQSRGTSPHPPRAQPQRVCAPARISQRSHRPAAPPPRVRRGFGARARR